MSLAESLEASMTLNNGRYQSTEIFYLFIQCQFCGKHYQIFTISIFYAQQKPYIFSFQNQYQKKLCKRHHCFFKNFMYSLEVFMENNIKHLMHTIYYIQCFASRILAHYGHFLVSVTKIIMGIYKIYFMEHSILHFKLLLLYVSNKRSQKSYQFFPIKVKNLCFLKNFISNHIIRFKHI